MCSSLVPFQDLKTALREAVYCIVPVCVEGHARAWPRDAEGECGGVAGEGVGRGGVLLQEVSPLLVVVIPEHVERLWKHSCKLYRPIPDLPLPRVCTLCGPVCWSVYCWKVILTLS